MDIRTDGNSSTRRLLQAQRALLPPERSHGGLRLLNEPVQSNTPQLTDEEDVPYPLTEEEAFAFLENVLGIPEPRKLLGRDPHQFLDTFTLLMNTKIPFTNLHVLGIEDIVSFRCPSLQECKEAMFKRHGGSCVYVNIFTKALLDVIGFETFHIDAGGPGEAGHATHVSTILCGLTHPGSRHLVDPGTVRPLHRAIPLDFEEESPIYRFNYTKVKLFKRDHGTLLSCLQVPGPRAPSSYVLRSEGRFWKVQLVYRFRLKRSRAHWLEWMGHIYHFPSSMASIYKSIGFYGHVDGRCVTIRSTGKLFTLRCEHSDPSEVETTIMSRDDFLDFFGKRFPQYPRIMIELAIENAKYVQNMYNI